MNYDYSYSTVNKYKLNKTTSTQFNNTINRLNNRTNMSSRPVVSQFKLVKSNPSTSTSSINNNAKLTENNLLISKSIESSNKLDDLLKRCREIGSSSTSVASSVSSIQTTIQPVKSEPVVVNNQFKLVKNIKSTTSSTTLNSITKKPCLKVTRYSLSKLAPTSRKQYYLGQVKLVSKSISKPNICVTKVSKFKLINTHSSSSFNSKINQIVNKRPVISLSRFKLINHTLTAKQPTKQQLVNRKNLYKINNIKSLRKIIINKRFKLIKENANNSLKSRPKLSINPNQIIKKYKMLTSTKLVNNYHNHKPTLSKTTRSSSLSSLSSSSATAKTSLNSSLFKLNNKNKNYCLFYNRFGRCSRGSSCKLIHDPKRVALCPRFLRGTCKLENCPFSHAISAEKTPLCSFYASGCCNRLNCPYSHVYLGKNVEFCFEFARGFCSLGSNCKKTHLIECPDFKENKKCPRGKKCPLLHRLRRTNDNKSNKTTIRKNNIDLTETNNETKPQQRVRQEFGASFISFDDNESITSAQTTDVCNENDLVKQQYDQVNLKTRPNFGKKK